jgi:ATP-dependent RNA helicase TDRD9
MGALLMTCNGQYVDDDGDLTYIGHIMAALPLDTHLSKLIIIGHMFSVLNECIIMGERFFSFWL